jgi:hypothetical protein
MSKLDALIKELCPNEVPHKTLGEIVTDMYRGSGIKREEVTATGRLASAMVKSTLLTAFGLTSAFLAHKQALNRNSRKIIARLVTFIYPKRQENRALCLVGTDKTAP